MQRLKLTRQPFFFLGNRSVQILLMVNMRLFDQIILFLWAKRAVGFQKFAFFVIVTFQCVIRAANVGNAQEIIGRYLKISCQANQGIVVRFPTATQIAV